MKDTLRDIFSKMVRRELSTIKKLYGKDILPLLNTALDALSNTGFTKLDVDTIASATLNVHNIADKNTQDRLHGAVSHVCGHFDALILPPSP